MAASSGPIIPVPDDKIHMQHWWNDNYHGKTEVVCENAHYEYPVSGRWRTD